MENEETNNEDISKEIEKTSEQRVEKDIAEKEEKIAKSVVEMPTVKDELEERKKKAISFLKQKKDWAIYIILSFIVFVSVYIRTRNIPRLKDITTGTWTLGPDLDPFLFLRWAKDIAENGKLFVLDVMRSVPLAGICSGSGCGPIDTSGEMKLLSYMIAWFYHFLSFFSKEVTVTYAAILFPVLMFALTGIAFFLFARKIFYKENKKTRNIIALISTAFFVTIPSLLPRTIAGIPEKESAAFFFMFMAFYLFLEAFTSSKLKRGVIFGILAGISTALMGLIWGGVLFIFFTIPVSVLLAFLFGKVKIKELFIYSSWLIVSLTIMNSFSNRYVLRVLFTSTSTGLAIGVFALLVMSLGIMKIDKLKKIRKKIKLPKEIFSLIISVLILFIIVLIAFGSDFIFSQLSSIKNSLITPMTTRFGLTVAENKQPYFINDWKNSFGPVFSNIPLFFWLFFIGAVTLFNNLIKKLVKKEKLILTFSYFVFLICLIFSRYSSGSILNGTSGLSLFVYFGGWLFFLGSFGYLGLKNKYPSWIKYYLSSVLSLAILGVLYSSFFRFYLLCTIILALISLNIIFFGILTLVGMNAYSDKEFNFSYILYFLVLTLGIIGARGGIRLIMVLGAVSPVAVAFLIVKVSKKYFSEKDDAMKFFVGILALIIIFASVFTLWSYYQQDKYTAENFAPGIYQHQWQKAMEWIRENTSPDAVFAHWWDYGYWVQSIGERATILDGGNAIVYWNHLMGRHVLTGPDEEKALEFLYTHNGTHLLIDSTEIGKYTAYSSIGSDENYDRFSWISNFLMDEKQTQETKNQTIYIYPGGSVVDEDTVWEQDGKEIFLPKKSAGIGAVVLMKDQDGEFLQPEAVFVYNGQQYKIPLRFLYVNKELKDFESGLEAGIFTFPKLDVLPDGKVSINEIGALMYLSKRTIYSQLANLYLFSQKSDYFKLAHSEDSFVVENLKQQGLNFGEFLYYQGFQGPIKIWEITYPSDIKLNTEYLEIEFPNQELNMAKPGEYN